MDNKAEYAELIRAEAEAEPANKLLPLHVENALHKPAITEAEGREKGWYEEARKQTIETLEAFCTRLMGGFIHDYGTVVHALAACALAGASAADHHPEQGGISGFQAGGVMWEFIKNWGHKDGPMRLLQFSEMLYPQNEAMFTSHISKDAAKWLQERAAQMLLDEFAAHPDVRAHWTKIAAGDWLPFGFTVKEKD